MSHDARKPNIRLEEAAIEEMRAEARRLQRSLSWVMRWAWRNARRRIGALPTCRIEEAAQRTGTEG